MAKLCKEYPDTTTVQILSYLQADLKKRPDTLFDKMLSVYLILRSDLGNSLFNC